MGEEILNEPFKALEAGLFISRGKSRHMSREMDSFELIFIVSGTLDMFEEECQYHLKAGDRLLLKNGLWHGGLSDYVKELSFFWLHFVPRNEIAKQIIMKTPSMITVANRVAAAEYFQLYLARQTDEPNNQAIRDLIFKLIWHECSCAKNNITSTMSATPISVLVRRAERIIQLHFYEPLSTSMIANELNCNPDYLGRIYKTELGVTITQDIHRKRLELVIKLLLDSQLSIKEIATRTGFDDISHFRRIFFRHFAMTPRDFRKRHARGRANTE